MGQSISLGYNQPMRRLLAILMLCVFGLPMATPLLAATADRDAGLPACCRRSGAHHCSRTMGRTSELSQGSRFAAPRESCPNYPAATTSVRHNEASLLTASPFLARHLSQPSQENDLPSRLTSALDQSRHERGPPLA